MSVFLLQRLLQRTQNEKIMTFVGSSSSSPLSSRSLRLAGMGPSLQSLLTFHQYVTKKKYFWLFFSHFQDKMQRTLLIHSDAAVTIITNFSRFFRTSRIQEYKTHTNMCKHETHTLSLPRTIHACTCNSYSEWVILLLERAHQSMP